MSGTTDRGLEAVLGLVALQGATTASGSLSDPVLCARPQRCRLPLPTAS